MRRVAVTGMGIISCLGNDRHEVLDLLRAGRSGIRYIDSYETMGLRTRVAGVPDMDPRSRIDRKFSRFMGDSAAFAYLAMREALDYAGMTEELISHPRTGLVVGSGGVSAQNVVEAADIFRERGVKKVGPYRVPRTMSSTTSACLATSYRILGMSYGLTSACATSTHCIGHAMDLIQSGKQDIIFAGAGEEVHWCNTMMFDAMGALSTKYNDAPETASRPYDADRDGFVIAGGGGMLVLEELDHARKRGAPVIAELVGFGATSDGCDMVSPSGEGAVRCMQMALDSVTEGVDYVNSHGTSTRAGDILELIAIREVIGNTIPPISSTKSLSGHALGAAGVHEAIYCLLMLQEDFIAASANIENLDPGAEGAPIVTEHRDDAGLRSVLTNNFGFGGTNGCLVFTKFVG